MPRYRFGVYEFDPSKGELRRDGHPVRLQAQPAQALGFLLSSAGETVSREELRRAIWDTETFVDFERGLNFCIAQIRSALQDSADSPRYVRTMPRKGYQFIAPVTVLPDPSDTVQAAPVLLPVPEELPAIRSTGRSKRLLMAASALVLTLCASVVLLYRSGSGEMPASRRVAVFRLDNATGDPQYELVADVITDSLIAELTESGMAAPGQTGYSVIGNDAELRRPRSQRDLPAIGTRLNTPVTISGSIRRSASPGGGASPSLEIFVQLITIPDQQHRKVMRVPLAANALSAPPSEAIRNIARAFDPAIRSTYLSP